MGGIEPNVPCGCEEFDLISEVLKIISGCLETDNQEGDWLTQVYLKMLIETVCV